MAHAFRHAVLLALLSQACLLPLCRAASLRSSVVQARVSSSDAAAAAGAAGRRSGDADVEPRKAGEGGRFAFAMMAFDPPGSAAEKRAQSLWGVLSMAHALRNLSSHPLVVLTNTTHFPDGSQVVDSLRRLKNVQVLPVQPVPIPEELRKEFRYMPCQEQTPPVCEYQFLKLQVWNLTQFDKVIWMDSDGIVTRGLDDLFRRPGTWAQQDNWDCGSWVSWATRSSRVLTKAVDWMQRELGTTPVNNQSDQVCSGLVALEPKEETYEGLIKYMARMKSAPGGDQQVISEYFHDQRGEPVGLLDPSVASFGQCVGKGIPGYVSPAFVHKSDWVNSCFHLGAKSAECQAHPLGRYWHEHFCKARSEAGLGGTNLDSFCTPWA